MLSSKHLVSKHHPIAIAIAIRIAHFHFSLARINIRALLLASVKTATTAVSAGVVIVTIHLFDAGQHVNYTNTHGKDQVSDLRIGLKRST